MKKVLWLLILLFPINVLADENLSLSCDAESYNVNDQIICRVSINEYEFNYNKIEFNIELSDGIEYVDVRSNYDRLWDIAKKKKSIVASTRNDEFLYGLQEFGIILFKAKESGTQTIKLTNIDVSNTKEFNEKEEDAVSIDFKIISSDNYLKGININDESVSDFLSGKYSYSYTASASDDVKIDAFTNNEFAKLSGNDTYKISDNSEYFYYPITVTSEDGNKRIYTIKVINKDYKDNEIDKKLDTLLIKNKNEVILFDFNSDTFEYNINVDSSVKSLNIVPTLRGEGVSFVKNYGSQTVDLNYGDNIYFVKVKDKENKVLTYVLNVTRPVSNKSTNSYLGSLKIKDVDLSFGKKVKNYVIKIDKGVTKLDIDAKAENAKSKVSISGNDNLKKGSVIKILVTSEGGTKTTYQLTVDYKSFDYARLVYIVIFSLIVIYLIYNVYSKYKIVIKSKKKAQFKENVSKKVIIEKEIQKEVKLEEKENIKPGEMTQKPVIKKENKSNSKNSKKANSKKKTTTATKNKKTSNSNKSKTTGKKKHKYNKKK